jgi:pyruvate-formate lyase
MFMLNPVIAQAVKFTDTYKKYADAPVPIREAMCLQAQYPELLPPIKSGDLYAGGRAVQRIVNFNSIHWNGMPECTPENIVFGKHGGYCFDFSALYTMEMTDEERAVMEELTAFWRREATIIKIHEKAELKESVGFLCPHDLDALVTKGLPGITADVTAMEEGDFRTGLLLALETVRVVFHYYIQQAEEQERADIAANLSALLQHAPATLAQALQLILFFELLTHERHYEINRLDVAVGDIYKKEQENETLTEAQAVEQIRAFYQNINENGEAAVCRLVMGGKGRRNAENADAFIVAALKAAQLHRKTTPQVTVRIFEGMNPEILSLSYDTVNITGTFPMLFNDDNIIPGVAQAYGVSLEAACDYYPCGCGEIVLTPHSPAILCVSWDIPRLADEAIRGAKSETFDELYRAVITKMEREAITKARYHRQIIDTHNAHCAFLMTSLFLNDCIRKGKPPLNGGARYNGAVTMGHGFTNAADALTAIKKLVYDEKALTLDEILEAQDVNFEGREAIRKALTAAPKYGNDHEGADEMTANLWRDISLAAKKAGEAEGFSFFTVSSVNPGGYDFGKKMDATADGRLRGQPYAIGNAPTAGMDKNGLTALMNSVLTTEPANGGTMTNFKVSREFFTKDRDKFEALFAAYWENGGLQANITIVSKGELEAALKEPHKYPHLMVRLGGWTARFIDLERSIQEDIIKRTMY